MFPDFANWLPYVTTELLFVINKFSNQQVIELIRIGTASSYEKKNVIAYYLQ